MNLIKGTEVADAMIQKMKGMVEFQEGKKPCLAIVRVGEKQDDIAYERGAVNRLKAEHVSPECIVIDVGINMDENGKLCGDVDFDNVTPVIKGITPVPGGVGSVTTYVLAKHVMQAAGIAV